MIAQTLIAEVLDTQNEFWLQKDTSVPREKSAAIKVYAGFASIITGIRRCGKSTLLRQLLSTVSGNTIFLNFEDPRLTGFERDDFRRLDLELKNRKTKNLFFDEIQMLDNWELYVRQKLDEGFNVIVTGSNATLLSKEMGTKLTGRHLSGELFPFSFSEYLKFNKKRNSEKALLAYLKDGGFPEFLKLKNPQILQQLLDDILLRDIAVRYAVRDVGSLRKLAVYLVSHIGKPISATKLKDTLNIKATSTVLEYFSYMEDAYLVQFVSKFSYSLQVQIRNPKKVYAIDLGLFTHNSITFSDENGRRLENLVYLHYRRQGKEITYFSEKKECDFIISEKGKVKSAVQVCYEITQDNLQREIDGLMEALRFLKLKKGSIITLKQSDVYHVDGKEIELIPVSQLLLELT
ncbi:ATP-binding protein [Niabella yanshanensis]|uniref:ATP-binding protein n=1 Tax=Niabella yanshanensis TaxID=577386 RepID=A0ABZ0W3N9_9BACT|nr:ATP-binding protein [Niabella yanshanensis]WQD37243.1 ATP-binding protein [Niabella yanshanensis]